MRAHLRLSPPIHAALAAVLTSLVACGGGPADQKTPQTSSCADASTCPAPSGPCQAAACSGGACGFTNAAAGTRISDAAAGDCRSDRCDGNGRLVASATDDADVPAASGPCHAAGCSGGTPQQTPLERGTACTSVAGGKCDGAGACVQCLGSAECASGVCQGGACQAPACDDGVENGNETGTDCGGPDCAPCPAGQGCGSVADCQSGVCTGGVCQAPTCSDGVENGDETAKDCGGLTCPPCAAGLACSRNADCQSGACRAGACTKVLGAACDVGSECPNGFCEDGVCCATSCSGPCVQCNGAGTPGTCTNAAAGSNPRSGCSAAPVASCGNTGSCDGAGACAVQPRGAGCAAANCTGATLVPARTCDGAGTCEPAAPSSSCDLYQCNPAGDACLTTCNVPGDCTTATCLAGSCRTPTCDDRYQDGAETDVDCGGTCPKCANGMHCGTNADCTSGLCSNLVCVPSCTTAGDCQAGQACNLTTHTCDWVCGASTTSCNGGCCHNPSGGALSGVCVSGLASSACGLSGTCVTCGGGNPRCNAGICGP